MEKSVSKTITPVRFRINQQLCCGCSICVDTCPSDAISLYRGKAWISPIKCKACGRCVNACPQKAIVELVSIQQLKKQICDMDRRADDVLSQIEQLSSRSACNYSKKHVRKIVS